MRIPVLTDSETPEFRGSFGLDGDCSPWLRSRDYDDLGDHQLGVCGNSDRGERFRVLEAQKGF